MAAQAVYLGSSGLKIGLVHKFVDTSIVQTGDTQHEYRKRHPPLSLARRAWTINWVGTIPPTVERLFEVFGTHTSWLLQPPREADYIEASPQVCQNTVTGLFTGDGSTNTFQIYITRTLGTITGRKKVMHPRQLNAFPGVTPAPVVRVNGVTKTETTHYTINYSIGIITFTGGNTPANGHVVDATYHYDTAVRGLSEELETSIVQASGSDPWQEITSWAVIEVFDE